jgi:glyoxylase I family protein
MAVELSYLTPMLQVFDMPRSLRFYCDILDFYIVEKAGPENDIGWVWLRRDCINLMLNTAYELSVRPALEDVTRVKAHEDPTLYFGCPNVDGLYQELKAKGIVLPEPKVAPYGMKQVYVKDPDGFNLCFQWAAN